MEGVVAELVDDQVLGLRDELVYFCACVRENRQPAVLTPVEAKNGVRVALALIESAEQSRDVGIPQWD